MEILKCNADFDKVYYVEYNNKLCQCKLIKTESGGYANGYTPVYVLNVAGIGEVRFSFPRMKRFDTWYHTSKSPSILYESIEDYRKGTPIEDDYGSMSNAYNSRFIKPLFKHHSPCNCGGSTYTWKWDGCKAVCYSVSVATWYWSWDKDGFHCSLNDDEGCFRSKQECEEANQIEVVEFK